MSILLRRESNAARPLERARNGVVVLLVLLFALTYLDRICISVAGPRMQADLHIDPVHWGWVTGIFTLSYSLFELPSGLLGDHIGPRRVLTRIVLWWSLFTALTGAVTRYPLLLATRFLFGAGEAGAYPNASVVVARWFPVSRRATMSGVTLMASQMGGALAPLLVVPLQMRFGWRAAFFAFGALGVVWALIWYGWFRDSPGQKLGSSEVADSGTIALGSAPLFPWRDALQSGSVLALLGIGFCYVYVYNFFQTWFHTFLVNGRGFREEALYLSAIPYVIAGLANLGGGRLSDALVARLGRSNGRRLIGTGALLLSAAFFLGAASTRQQMLTIVLLCIAYGAITFQQSVAFGVCLDLGQARAGAITGLFNTVCQVGGLIGSVAYGYIVERSGSYDAPFFVMAGLLLAGAALWWTIDASRQLVPVPA